jgi:hypothetical protein
VNQALKSSRSCDALVLLLRTQLVSLVEQSFLLGSKNLCAHSRTDLLTEFQPWLAVRKFYQLCLACIQAEPEHKLTCGHLICERCFTCLASNSEVDPHLYKLSCCPFCSKSCHASLRVKPATAGFRVLSIDGGGIRAAIPIQFLRALEQAVGIGMPIQELFDLGYGTSSGRWPQRVPSPLPI